MILEKDLKASEEASLDEKIANIELMFESRTQPRAFELGMLLALKMAKEMREGKELGTDSSYVVASWVDKYPNSIVEEAIASAKEFLVNPGKLADKIKESLLKH